MKAIGTVAAAAALAGARRLRPARARRRGGAGGNEAAGNEAAGNDCGRQAGREGAGNQADAGAGLGGKDRSPAPPRRAATAAVRSTAPIMLGRWTDDGDCDNAVDFLADGRLVAANGREGLWNLAGDRLTLTVDDDRSRVQFVPIDQNIDERRQSRTARSAARRAADRGPTPGAAALWPQAAGPVAHLPPARGVPAARKPNSVTAIPAARPPAAHPVNNAVTISRRTAK